MKTIKDTALATAKALAAAEAAVGDGPGSEELAVLHKELRAGLYSHRDQLGLSDDDVAEIDNSGAENFGGTPKGPPPEGEGGG